MASVYEEKKLKEKLAAAQSGLAGVSAATQKQLEAARQNQSPSQQTVAAQQAYQQVQSAKPKAYVSAHEQQLSDLYNKIVNRPAFAYDAAGDPVYQQYKDQYIRQGQRAMKDTQGQAAALTGGYGSSYAVTAGNQAYQEQLTHLNDTLPQLYQQARSRYDAEGQQMKDLFALTQERESQDYSRWADAYQRWQNEHSQAQRAYESQRDYEQKNRQAQLSYWQGVAQAENGDYRKGQSQAYGLALEMIQAGKTPDDSLLWQAGLSARDVEVLQTMYAPKKKNTAKKKTVIQLAQPQPMYQL